MIGWGNVKPMTTNMSKFSKINPIFGLYMEKALNQDTILV
jgi:hypothetical protein